MLIFLRRNDVRFIFPYIEVFLECISTFELLLEGLLLICSKVKDDLLGKVFFEHPFTFARKLLIIEGGLVEMIREQEDRLIPIYVLSLY